MNHKAIKLVLMNTLGTVVGILMCGTLCAAETNNPDLQAPGDKSTEKISLIEVEPELIYSLRRYSKFYGDDNTIHGNIFERSYLFGDLGGIRNTLVEHGIYFDAGVTQFFQVNASGGDTNGSIKNSGSADYYLSIDTGKAGLWSGGVFMFHAESSWQADRSINNDTGSLLPASFDAVMPTPGKDEALLLPEAYLLQALPGNMLLTLGKADFAGFADQNVFANNERTQFSYAGLVNNPILGAFVPYTPLGGSAVWAPNRKNTVALVVCQAKGEANNTGFNNFNGDSTVGFQYQFSPVINANLPGNYRVIAGYSNKDLPSFDIGRRQLIGELVGVKPPIDKSDNYTLLFNFDQYLLIKGGSLEEYQKRLDESGYPGVGHHHLPPVGIGIFGRAGWAPDDRNVIDQFYSLGIGGYGGLFTGRYFDQWGIGWAATHISSDFRDDVGFLGVDVDTFEHSFEVFYNFQLTPAANLTVNAQVMDSAEKSFNTAFTVGTRLQIDF